jgi:transmembrane 9 superfamily protein 2/4
MVIVSYVLLAGFAGYVSARIYKTCGGTKWRQNIFWTTMLIPGSLFLLLVLLNFVFIARKSSSALPFGTLFALFSLWFFLSIPLGLLGAYFGFKKQVFMID